MRNIIKLILLFNFLIPLYVNSQILTVSSNKIIVASSDNSQETFDIFSSNCLWGICNFPSWITLNTYWGSGNKSVVITVSENPYTIQRSGSLTVYLLDNDYNYVNFLVVTVNQLASQYGVSDTVLYISNAKGSQTSFSISTPSYWEIVDLPAWLSTDKNYKTGNDTITLTAQENPQYQIRKAEISVKHYNVNNNYINSKILILQTPSQYGVSTDKIILRNEIGATYSFGIKCNGQWNIIGKSNWFEYQKIPFTDSIKVSVTDINKKSYYRADTITIYANNTQYQVTVLQNPAKSNFSFSPTTLFFQNNALNKISIFITSNTNWGIIQIPEWINPKNFYGYGNDTVVLSAGRNNSGKMRSDSILFYWYDENYAYHQKWIWIGQSEWTGVKNIENKMPPIVTTNTDDNFFSVKLPSADVYSVSIYTVKGKLISSITPTNNYIDTSNLEKGTYIVKIISTKGDTVSKIIVK